MTTAQKQRALVAMEIVERLVRKGTDDRYVVVQVSAAGRGRVLRSFPSGQRSGAVDEYIRQMNRAPKGAATVLYDRAPGTHLYRHIP